MKLNIFLQQGIKRIGRTASRYYLTNPEGRRFLARMLPQLHRNDQIRKQHEENGTHIPPFLIASIASQCNLHCQGCYARAGGACGSSASPVDLSTPQWLAIFEEAATLGISFVLLAGGEPFIRRDVLEAAAAVKNIIFPVFTNGTMIDDKYLTLLAENRNLIPVLSIEGGAAETDQRRGAGTYAIIDTAMKHLQEKGILFGTSITVTRENMTAVTASDFISKLRRQGCGLVFFVEYVPVSKGTEYLALTQADIDAMDDIVTDLKQSIDDMIILSFPGDEAAMGGCLASGRGFFHINSAGGAEPCPFSPYSKLNLKDASILDVLASDYFSDLRSIAANAGTHTGGCTLFTKESEVKALIKN